MSDSIKKIVLKDGITRYRFVVDIPREKTGKRRQLTRTFDKKKDARAELDRIRGEVGQGTFIAPKKTSLSEVLDAYLVQAERRCEAGTAANYRDALLPVRERLGHRNVQSLSEGDIDALVDWMLTSARKRGGKPGTGLSARSVSLSLGQLRAALKLAQRRKVVATNVAIYTEIPKTARDADRKRRAERRPWTADEVRQYLAAIDQDRLYPVILLSLMGLRPAETCGLMWSAVDLKKAAIRIENTRTIVDGAVIEKDTKSAAGRRSLPLPATAAAALKEFKRLQAEEKLAAGTAYLSTPYVLVDEIGAPFKTDQLRRRMYRLMADANVRKVRPYDARHACLTYLAANGVPDVVVSAWAGHADLSLAKKVYVHPDETHLRPAAEHLDGLLDPRRSAGHN